jgi:hypothetical protein
MDHSETQVSCTECGVSLTGAPFDQPCATCGSDCKTVHIFATDTGTISAFEEAEVEYEVGRTWVEQWGRIERHYLKLQDIYGGAENGEPSAWKAVMGDFAVAVHHLAEWLDRDTAVPPTVGASALQYVHSDPSLSLAVAVSNSYKHHTRRSGVQADISSIYSSSRGNALKIGWRDDRSGTHGVQDGLQLADDCVASWRRFMSANSLSVP